MSLPLALPTSRDDEAWRWSDLGRLPALAAAAPAGGAVEIGALWIGTGPRLLFVDGVLDAAASNPGPVRIGPPGVASDHPLGRLAAGGAGWTLAVDADGAAGPVEIVHVATGGANHVAARIMLAADAQASLVETHVGAGWANRLTAIGLGRGARLMRSVRLLQDDGFTSLRDEADLGTGASLVSVVLGGGGAGTRIDAAVTLSGEGAFAEVGGALLVAARVEVARGAQKTDGEQSLRGLLLRRGATVNLKPELEIFADDVKCAHGATVGELDRAALFYLASRGVPPAEAEAILTRSFVADAIGRIGEDAVRDAFQADADRWLEARA